VPASYTIDAERKLVISRLWNPVTDDDVFEHNRLLRTDPMFDPTYRQLADMSEVTDILVTTGAVEETSRDQFFTPGARRAFVAAEGAPFGLARMYALRANDIGQVIEVFQDRPSAEAWLEL
jgi:hypothetical protein